MNKCIRNKILNKLSHTAMLLSFIFTFQLTNAQSKIHYADKEIFLSGTNIAWVNFSNDIGPAVPDLVSFNSIFRQVRQNGGNALRFWLHTNGSQTPVFDANGYVTGPGTNTIKYLQQVLSVAAQNHVGLQLCLWSFDMLSTKENLSAAQMTANTNLLNDTSYTNTYIRNCLIPMVEAVKGNPAVISWEVFNEPEGMSPIGNYSGVNTAPINSIQRFINLVAGAIHRTDPNAIVTNGSGSLRFSTDVAAPLSKASVLNEINSMSVSKKQQITAEFNNSHRTSFTTDEYISYIVKLAATPNYNYYRDDRLIAAGGDTMGTLDFYNTHFYANGSSDQSLSPFNHPYSAWALTKPLVIAEFYDIDSYGVSASNLYETLYLNGYAGALSWSWTESSQPDLVTHVEPLQNMFTIFNKHRADVQIFPITGSIYSFTADTSTIQKGDNTKLRWDSETGSTVTLNGKSVSASDSLIINPSVTTVYTLTATGKVDSTLSVTVNVLPTGRILSFKASAPIIGTGESTTLIWQVVKNSVVKLNGNTVKVQDTLVVYPTDNNNTYNLVTSGDESDSLSITIQILPADQVDRTLGAVVTTSSNDTVNNIYSKPGNIVDGNYFTNWLAAAKSGQWVKIDMGRIITINEVIIYWGSGGYAKQYSLQCSNDLITWNILKSTSSGTGGTSNTETLSSLQADGRYVYLLLQSAGQNAFSLRELEIYGVPKVSAVVNNNNSKVPTKYSLYQNYPNPFNPATNIQFDIPKTGESSIIVYNILGQKVAGLLNQELKTGSYTVSFDASRLSSGIYFYTLRSGNFITTKKMILLK